MKNNYGKISVSYALGISIFVALLFLLGKFAMIGILGKHTMFSNVSGKIHMEGQPVAGATVKQTVRRGNGNLVTQSTETGPEGEFSFAKVTANKTLVDLLPSEVVIQQEITIIHDNKNIQGWLFTKRDGLEGSESLGKPFNLVCDISKDPDFERNYFGVCRISDKP